MFFSPNSDVFSEKCHNIQGSIRRPDQTCEGLLQCDYSDDKHQFQRLAILYVEYKLKNNSHVQEMVAQCKAVPASTASLQCAKELGFEYACALEDLPVLSPITVTPAHGAPIGLIENSVTQHLVPLTSAPQPAFDVDTVHTPTKNDTVNAMCQTFEQTTIMASPTSAAEPAVDGDTMRMLTPKKSDKVEELRLKFCDVARKSISEYWQVHNLMTNKDGVPLERASDWYVCNL